MPSHVIEFFSRNICLLCRRHREKLKIIEIGITTAGVKFQRKQKADWPKKGPSSHRFAPTSNKKQQHFGSCLKCLSTLKLIAGAQFILLHTSTYKNNTPDWVPGGWSACTTLEVRGRPWAVIVQIDSIIL